MAHHENAPAVPATIGYYDDSRGSGGTTRYLMELLRALDRSRFHPVFFAREPADWHDGLRDIGVAVIGPRDSTASQADVPSPVLRQTRPRRHVSIIRSAIPASTLWTVGLARDVAELVRLFKRCPVDLLHSNNAGAEAAPIAAFLAGAPRRLATWHIDPSYDLLEERQAPRYRLLERASMLSLNGAIAVSHATRAAWIARCRLPERFQSRVAVVHNGIDLSSIRRHRRMDDARAAFGCPAGVPIIGSVGRFDLAKGYEYLIRAMPQMMRAHPDLLLAIAGDGPLREELHALAIHLDVDRSVLFLGRIADVTGFLECLDVYTQPSLCEALPFAVEEASAVGLPVVATSVGGLPELIRDGETGYLISPRDSNGLARAALRLLEHPELREWFGKRGRARMERLCTRENMVRKTTAVYEAMLRPAREEAVVPETSPQHANPV